jgi:hypothetical protein
LSWVVRCRSHWFSIPWITTSANFQQFLYKHAMCISVYAYTSTQWSSMM